MWEALKLFTLFLWGFAVGCFVIELVFRMWSWGEDVVRRRRYLQRFVLARSKALDALAEMYGLYRKKRWFFEESDHSLRRRIERCTRRGQTE